MMTLAVPTRFKRIRPGVYTRVDREDVLHVDMPELLEASGFDNTAANRGFWGRDVLRHLRGHFGTHVIIARMHGVRAGGILQ